MTTTTITTDTLNPFAHKPNENDAFAASLLTSLFHSLAGTWTHELRMENATMVDLPTTGHGLCNFTSRAASKIKGLDDSADSVEEMLIHENGDYSIEGSGQSSIYMPSLLWSRNFVWRMDKRGSNPAVVRPQLEKQRKSSGAGRKGSFFRRMSIRNSDPLPIEKEAASRRMSTQSEKGDNRSNGSMWRRMTVPVIRRNSKAEALEEEQAEPKPEPDDPIEEVPIPHQTEIPLPPSQNEATSVIPQIDIYTTKPQTRKLSFHLHTLTFNLQPETWHHLLSTNQDITLQAQGDHFSGEERYGTKYEFVLRPAKPTPRDDGDEDEAEAACRHYVERWSTVEVVRGPAGKDKTTTTRYTKTRRSRGSVAVASPPRLALVGP
jgi:hypothetical protein